ncbi:MAG: hypothetical protein KJ749_01085 [Planctomycetes bacterium]|nr:hypothetical protein [Planctomycetota bacterium]
MALYEDLSHLVEGMGCVSAVDYMIQVLRDDVDRAEPDRGTTGYTKREIDLIHKLLRDVECSD